MYRLKRRLKHQTSRQILRQRLVLWLGALAVGLAIVGFTALTDLSFALFQHIQHGYWPVLVTPLGLAFTAWLTLKLFPGCEGSGIPQAIASLQTRDTALKDSLLSLRLAIGKVVLTCLGLACGASIGREGPSVHIGSAIMYYVSRHARFSRLDIERGLIVAGGAAGISAAFNTPLAGIVFAIEEISRSFEERTSGTMMTAVILAGITAQFFLGNYTYFGTSSSYLLPTDLGAPLACGIVGGLFGGLFSQALILGSRALRPMMKLQPLKVAFLCGLLLSLCGLLSDGATYGSGYEAARHIMEHPEATSWDYPILKLLATMSAYWSGIPGGIFSPSLSAGAGFGAWIAGWFPHIPASAVIVLGIVAYFSGVVQTPITAFVIVMEMTENLSMLLPLMIASFVAYGISTIICPEPLYRALADAFLPGASTGPVPLPDAEGKTPEAEKSSPDG